MRELKKVYVSFGIMKIVSMFSSSFRFIRASWNSNSKSDTARRPRTMARAFLAATYSTKRPPKASASTLGKPATAPFTSAKRVPLQREQRVFALILGDRHDDSVKKFGGALHHVQMAVGQRVETAGIDRGSHFDFRRFACLRT